MAVHNVYVFDENGMPLMTIKLGSIDTDSALLTGFLSAIQSFSKKISQGDIEEINIKDYKFHIKPCGVLYVAMVADKTDQDARGRLCEVCKIIEKHQGNFGGNVMETEIKDAAVRKISMKDRTTSWAEMGL